MMISTYFMEMPEEERLDAKQAKARIEQVFSKYRMCKVMKFTMREARITANYEARENGATNRIGDPTSAIAIHNMDKANECLAFCGLIESIIDELEADEQLLIRERYMKAARMTDTKVYSFCFDPPISAVTYGQIRKRAFVKLLHAFQYALNTSRPT
ncbi:ArpU family phage packaging/lysis transcriptional regulator [Paenibacillus sp. UMB4589-SE434]|uniref:ArpU family phage packaging/lysis transcriptional regulator n=1 Tax=Paenibacillus sp. UMB4589-SE434 TaxID=3046314 RepID=UPI00254E863B|nr:ArpU family phage packaging/lysis transcriptional regulator [Paenibacillus sp. UMB4589-SE434]MDK8181954.1 ArpU family phage packaging/lysis transcriptional regulator [Paenibacillus sp. UMB4589-SE434]